LEINIATHGIAPIENLESLIESIDNKRKSEKRILETINNPESSRSIIVYEFVLQINGSNVPYIIVDLPGKEEFYDSYLNKMNLNYQAKLFNTTDYVSQPVRNHLSLVSMIYNPIFLGIFWDDDIINVFNTYNATSLQNHITKIQDSVILLLSSGKRYQLKDICDQNDLANRKITYKINPNDNPGLPMKSFLDNNNLTNLVSFRTGQNINSLTTKFQSFFLKKLIAVEILRYFIIEYDKSDKYDIIEKFLARILTVLGAQDTKYDLLSYQGYYINENVGGLLEYLGIASKKPGIIDNAPKDPLPDTVIETIKEFIGFNILITDKSNGINSIFSDAFYNNPIVDALLNIFENRVSDYLRNSYDSNKIYIGGKNSTENPLISELLKPYFDVQPTNPPQNPDDKIKSYKLLYVLTNNDNEFKCDKQLNLLDNTYKFLSKISS
jgi:hypothetical protein